MIQQQLAQNINSQQVSPMSLQTTNGLLNYPQNQFVYHQQQQPVFLPPSLNIHSVSYLPNQTSNIPSLFGNNTSSYLPVPVSTANNLCLLPNGQVLTPLVSRAQQEAKQFESLNTPTTPITFELVLKPDKKYTQSDFYTFEAASNSMSQPSLDQIKLVYSNDLSSEWRILDDNNNNNNNSSKNGGLVFKSINEATGSILHKFYLNKNKTESDTTQCKLDFNAL
jgi:hypothetical protein